MAYLAKRSFIIVYHLNSFRGVLPGSSGSGMVPTVLSGSLPFPRLHHRCPGVWQATSSSMWHAAACSSTVWLTPFCFRTFVSLVISSLSIFFSLSPTPIIWLLRVLTTVSFSSSCSLLAVSLSFYHSSGRFTKLWFLASPLNFVFISTIAFLIFM